MTLKRTAAAITIVAALVAAGFLLWPSTVAQQPVNPIISPAPADPAPALRAFLQSKNSPLAADAEFVVTLKHWRLLVAISAIESQYCKRLIAYNCWGVGGDSAYRHYSSFRAAIQDANDLIERWQKKGRWLTPEDMNCSYVVPCNENWVRVVNAILKDLSVIE